MAATVLNSERAIQMSVYVVRAFVEFKKSQDANVKVTRRLEALERSVSALDADTRRQFDQVYEAILSLMSSQPRNADRFPEDFLLELSNQEVAALRSQFALFSSSTKGTA